MSIDRLLPTPRYGKTTSETEEAWQRRHQEGKVATRPLGLAVTLIPESLLLQQAFTASPSLLPGSDAARQMTAGSGRRLSGALGKSSHAMPCLRILLDSQAWSSSMVYLKWTAGTILTKRRQVDVLQWVSALNEKDEEVWRRLWVTSKRRDTRSKTRLSFQLAPSTPRTGATGYSLLPTEMTLS